MSTSALKKKFFATFKEVIWPIEKGEMRLFLPMALMMLCVLFNFAALRSLKDGLVVPEIGAEAISFLKLWLVLPSSVIFTIVYAKLSNIFSFERVFYIVISIFLCIFLLFAYLLYPNQTSYHPDIALIHKLALDYSNLKWFIQIAGKWSYALMYIFSELWSVVIINLMFWQFANHIFDTAQAKRFYPILGMVGNFGLILAGNVLMTFSDVAEILDYTTPEYQIQCQKMLQPIILSIVFAGTAAMILFKIINSIILKEEGFRDKFHRVTEDSKTKLSLIESMRLIMNSRYICHIVVLVLCYGLVINLLEGPWKAKLRECYPNTIEYVNFMGQFNIYMGIASITFMIIGSNVLRKLSWVTAALFTPAMIFITGTIFFTFIIFAKEITIWNITVNPVFAAVIVGAVQNILSKSTKYSLFDSTKEMAYIPLSLELRTKGKATAEIIGLKFGKSLGAFVQSGIFIILPMASFNSISFYLMIIFMVFIVIWVRSVINLNKEYLTVCNTNH